MTNCVLEKKKKHSQTTDFTARIIGLSAVIGVMVLFSGCSGNKLDATVEYQLYLNAPDEVIVSNNNDFDWNNVIIEIEPVDEEEGNFVYMSIGTWPAGITKSISVDKFKNSANITYSRSTNGCHIIYITCDEGTFTWIRY